MVRHGGCLKNLTKPLKKKKNPSKLTKLWQAYLAEPSEDNLDAYRYQFILQAVRKDSSRWGAWQVVESNARVSRGVYLCAACGKHVGRKERQRDHIEPFIDVRKGFESWDTNLRRLFMEPGLGQIICKPCHKEKSKNENAERRIWQGNRKKVQG